MFSHIMVGSNDIARSRNSTMLCLSQWALSRVSRSQVAGYFTRTMAGVSPIDAKPPGTHTHGGTIGFTMAGPAQADAWHKAGVANGGTSIEDPPGVRRGAAGETYLAYLRDPDGNKLCALIASQLPEYSPFKIEEGHPFRAVLAREGTLRGPVRALSWERSRRASDYRRPPLRISHCVSDSAAKPRHPPALGSSPA